jgi:sugar phosphate isomerase/epimerase
MLKLAAFADEISPDLDQQIRVCKENSVTHFELRSVNKINVLDFDAALRAEIRTKLRANGMGVAAIGSPIGKVKISDPWPAHFDRFKIAVELAEYFDAPLVRIFSYYPPEQGEDIHKHRDEVMKRMGAKAAYVADRNVVLVHENEARIYGERGKDCLDLMRTIDSPKLRSAFDFANFIMCDEHPLDNWELLKPYTAHIHIKDASLKTHKVLPAGEGDGQIEPILVDAVKSGYREFVSLEPHLAIHGSMGGFSGPELFKRAADALKGICSRNGFELAR